AKPDAPTPAPGPEPATLSAVRHNRTGRASVMPAAFSSPRSPTVAPLVLPAGRPQPAGSRTAATSDAATHAGNARISRIRAAAHCCHASRTDSFHKQLTQVCDGLQFAAIVLACPDADVHLVRFVGQLERMR